MTANAEPPDDAIKVVRRRRPRTFVEPEAAVIESDLSLPEDDLDTELDDHVDEPQEQPGETEDAAPSYAYEAVACQVSLGPDEDAFASTLVLTGDDGAGAEVLVWMRLPPTVILRLTQQLTQVYRAQQEVMGLPGSDPSATHDDNGEDEDDERESLIRRATDPLGVRFLKSRPSSAKWLAIAIGSLLVISLILRATAFG